MYRISYFYYRHNGLLSNQMIQKWCVERCGRNWLEWKETVSLKYIMNINNLLPNNYLGNNSGATTSSSPSPYPPLVPDSHAILELEAHARHLASELNQVLTEFSGSLSGVSYCLLFTYNTSKLIFTLVNNLTKAYMSWHLSVQIYYQGLQYLK